MYGNGHQSKEISEDVTGLYFQDPFVAIVIDPVRTISAGKVNLGAFRTYPKGTSPSLIIKTLDYESRALDHNSIQSPSEYQTSPVFNWPICILKSNCAVFKWHRNTITICPVMS